MDIVDALRQTQRERGETNAAFAKSLGISTSMLRQVYKGERKPGLAVLKGLCRLAAHRTPYVILYLQEE